MKKLILFQIIIIILSLGGYSYAQQMTTIGTDFWVTSIGEKTSGSNDYSNIRLLFASTRDCNATITNPNTDWDTTIAISSNTGKSITLYYYNIPTLSGTEYNYGFHIATTDTVSLYAIDGNGSNSELSNVLPTQALGKEYIIQTYPTPQGVWWGNCSFAIVTTEDSTTVQITLNGSTNAGNQAGETIYKLIPTAGTCYHINSDYNTDLSGTRIISNKRIAVFQGNHESNVPIGNFYSTSGNHQMVEQAIPVTKWGRHFIVPHSGYNSVDKVRITAKEGPCSVYRNGQFLTYLIARGTYEYSLDSASQADYITTSKAASITSYNTTYYTESGENNYIINRTASSTTIHPIKNATKHIFYNFHDQLLFYNNIHNINIVAYTSDTNLIYFDSINIGYLFTPIENNRTFSIARIQNVTDSVHILTARGGSGFNAYCTHSKNGPYGAHSCPLGAAFPTTQNTLVIEGLTDATLLDTTNGCINHPIAISVQSEHETDSIRWFFDDGAQDYGANTQHSYSQAGIYKITAIVYSSCQECLNTADTLQTIARIFPNSTTIIDTLVFGCDSLFFNGNIYYTNDTAISNTTTNTMGCDSTTLVPLNIYHAYTHIDDITIYDTSSITWIDGIIYNESTTEPFIVLQSQNGCDSTIHLHLNVLPTSTQQIDSNNIWTPNIFTPKEETNNQFRIYCNDIISAEVSIFNRWGLLICTFDGLTNGWDGTYQGISCPQGTYVYIITYYTKYSPQYKQQKTGTVLLLK